MCMTSDPYAAGYTFVRSAFTGGPHPGPKGRTYDIYRYIYIDIYIYVIGSEKTTLMAQGCTSRNAKHCGASLSDERLTM